MAEANESGSPLDDLRFADYAEIHGHDLPMPNDDETSRLRLFTANGQPCVSRANMGLLTLEVRRLRAELARVAPALATHGVAGYRLGPQTATPAFRPPCPHRDCLLEAGHDGPHHP